MYTVVLPQRITRSAAIAVAFILAQAIVLAFPSAAAISRPPSSPAYAPMAVTAERYQWMPAFDPTWPCLSEDDALDWSASGSLGPGESFTFTPQYPDCFDSRAIVVTATWDAKALLEISSVVPGVPRYTGVAPGATITGAPIGSSAARICTFPRFGYAEAEWGRASFTVRNVGTVTAYTVALTGYDENDWEVFYYDACRNVDADRDGWSDSVEHGMENLAVDRTSPGLRTMRGSNYLSGTGTGASDDEFDFVPSDFDDDGLTTRTDVDRVSAHLGEGTGVPVSLVTPNSGPNNFYLQQGPWRRFDLDQDGYVTSRDVDLVASAASAPTGVPPTTAILRPIGTVPRGSWVEIAASASSTAGIAKVQFFVDSKLIAEDAVAPYATSWRTPSKSGVSRTIVVRAYDLAGRSSAAQVTVTTQ